jgi:hypothetical protein
MPAAVIRAVRPTGWQAREGLWSKALLRAGLTGHRKRMSQQRLLGQTVSNPMSRRRHALPHRRARPCWFQQTLGLGKRPLENRRGQHRHQR